MQVDLGYVLIAVGLLMVVLGVLVSLGYIKVYREAEREGEGGFWNFMTELLKTAPWFVVVGLILIYRSKDDWRILALKTCCMAFAKNYRPAP
jgi:hypothetical protein